MLRAQSISRISCNRKLDVLTDEELFSRCLLHNVTSPWCQWINCWWSRNFNRIFTNVLQHFPICWFHVFFYKICHWIVISCFQNFFPSGFFFFLRTQSINHFTFKICLSEEYLLTIFHTQIRLSKERITMLGAVWWFWIFQKRI